MARTKNKAYQMLEQGIAEIAKSNEPQSVKNQKLFEIHEVLEIVLGPKVKFLEKEDDNRIDKHVAIMASWIEKMYPGVEVDFQVKV